MKGDVFVVRYVSTSDPAAWTTQYHRTRKAAMEALKLLQADKIPVEVWRFVGPALCIVDVPRKPCPCCGRLEGE